jgi:hypothetical protein
MGYPLSRALAQPLRRFRPPSDGQSHAGARGTERLEQRGATQRVPLQGELRRRARYGGGWCRAATSLGLDGGFGQPQRLASLLTAVVFKPRRFASLIALLLCTPSELVSLSDSGPGLWLRHYFDARFLGIFPQNRLCRGVLLLPSDHAAYRRGRRRQALRTNLRRAAEAGVHCEVVGEFADVWAAVTAILARRKRQPDDLVKLMSVWQPLLSRPEITVLVARDQEHHPIGLLAVVIDVSVCLIQIAIASDHNGRWALHDYLVRILIDRNVECLLAEGEGPFGALGFEPELQHYQHLLGYELCHLIPRATDGS